MPAPRAATIHIDQMLSVGDERDLPVDGLVRKSWLRSATAYQIDPTSDQSPNILTASEIDSLRDPVQRSLQIMQVELDRLYKLVRPARYVVLFCSADGTVIDHRGEESEADEFKHWGVWLGGVWAEGVEGTNGIGTAITEGRPVTVHRTQHFKARHMDLSCSGAPIFDASGGIAGLLDVSSIDPQLSEHAHALTGGLAIDAARAIEERLFRDHFRKCWVLAIRIPDSFGNSMLIAVDRDHRVVGADRTGRSLLNRWGFNLDHGVDLDSLFKRASENLPKTNSEDDVWTLLHSARTGEAWSAIVTVPEARSVRRVHPPIDELYLRPRIDLLIGGRDPGPPPHLRGGLAPASLRRVLDYIDGHLSQSLDLEALAETAGLSMYHFARTFKHSQGITPQDYVLERRIVRARNLLTTTDLSLAQVAAAVGFADQSHFTRRFREAVGIAPGHFRRMGQGS